MGLSNSSRYHAKMKGDSWLISENKKTGKAKIVVNNSAVLEFYDHTKLIQSIAKKKSKKKTISWNFRDLTEGKLTGSWKKANLKKDADRLIKYLKAQQLKKNFWNQDSLGNWLLFAIHLNQKGMKDKANELAGIIFELGQGKRKVILQALNSLADTQYAAAYMTFTTTHDWKQYSADVDTIINRFRKGWKKTAGVKKLLVMLKKNIAKNNSAQVPAGVSKEDAEILKALINNKLDKFSGNLWVISDISSKQDKNKDKKQANIIEKITSRGIKSVPILISLIGDDQLVLADKDRFGNRFGYSRTYYNRSSSGKNDADTIFRHLKRPMTRGEVARAILNSVVIKEVETDSNGNEIVKEPEGDDSAEFKELCQKWYKDNKSKNDIDFARLYLKEGNKAQKNQAVNYMLSKKIKSEYPVIEKYLLSGTRAKYGNDFRDKLAIKYAGRRGPEAEVFVKKYIEQMDPDGAIQAEAEARKKAKSKNKDTKKEKKKSKNTEKMFIQNQDDMNSWQKKQILQVIEQLKGLTSKESIEDIIDDLLSGKKKWDTSIRQLLANRIKLSDRNIDDKLKILLNGALKAAKKNKGKVAGDFLSMAQACANGSLMSMNMMYYGAYNNNDTNDKENPPTAAKNKNVWLKLISSKTPFNKDIYGIPVSVGEISAIYSEIIYNKGNKSKLLYANGILGKANLERLVKRSKARFEGVKKDKLPKIPSISDLSEKTLKAETDKMLIKLKKAQDMPKFISKLSLHDFLILKRALNKDKAQNRKFISLANTVTSVTSSVKDGRKFVKFKGKPVSASMINELREFIMASLNAKKNIKCKLFRNALFKGVSIVIDEEKEKKKDADAKNKAKENIILSAEINIPGAFYCNAYWNLAANKTNKKTNADKKSDDEFDDMFSEMEEDIETDAKDVYGKKQKSFDEKVKMFEEGKLNSMLTGGIYLSGEVQ